jgi:small subunit ribosomal protein S17
MKILTGKVVSDKIKNTVVVEVVRFVAHPLYKKRMRRTKRYHAHSEMDVKLGSEIKIAEHSPISKTKTWKVIEVVNKNGST